MPIETTKAPPRFSSARRESVEGACVLVMTAPPSTHHLGGALDRPQNGEMRAAPAFEALQRIPDLALARLLVVAQERRRRHDPAIDAVAALRHLLFDIG